MRPVEKVLEGVEGVEERPNGYWELCPAHNDHNPSLHIEEAEDGRVLMICRAGCEQADVMAALERRGVRRRDLFSDNPGGRAASRKGHAKTTRKPAKATGRAVKSWNVKDVSGRLVAIHVRLEDEEGNKRFAWQHPDGRYSKNGEIRSAALPLYGSELVAGWPEDGEVVVLVEGEKAADALRRAGFRALGTVTGASKTPEPEALQALRGRRVVVWPDKDDQGQRHMERIAARLAEIAAEIRWFDWPGAPHKGDAADHPAVATLDREGLTRLKGNWRTRRRTSILTLRAPSSGLTSPAPWQAGLIRRRS